MTDNSLEASIRSQRMDLYKEQERDRQRKESLKKSDVGTLLDELEWPHTHGRFQLGVVRRDQFHCYAYFDGKYYYGNKEDGGPDSLALALKRACLAALGIADEGVES